MHAAAFAASELAGSYELIDTEPALLKPIFDSMRYGGFRGLNITTPHKQSVVSHCNRISEVARACGAVNTVVFESNGKSVGTNTDVEGFLKSLTANGQFDIHNKKALVLGSGGAARAVVVALISAGAKDIVVTSRTSAHAAALATDLSVSSCPMAEGEFDALHNIDLVVNATSCGMGVLRRTREWREAISFFDVLPWNQWRDPLAYDLIYTPARTPFLELAHNAGCPYMGGKEMLAYQGAQAFELWTGVSAEETITPMLEALNRRL